MNKAINLLIIIKLIKLKYLFTQIIKKKSIICKSLKFCKLNLCLLALKELMEVVKLHKSNF